MIVSWMMTDLSLWCEVLEAELEESFLDTSWQAKMCLGHTAIRKVDNLVPSVALRKRTKVARRVVVGWSESSSWTWTKPCSFDCLCRDAEKPEKGVRCRLPARRRGCTPSMSGAWT
jgi:hypothetical protein